MKLRTLVGTIVNDEIVVLWHSSLNLSLFLGARVIMHSSPELVYGPQAFQVFFIILLGLSMGAVCTLTQRALSGNQRWLFTGFIVLACAGLGGFTFGGFSIIAFIWGGIITVPGVVIATARKYILALTQSTKTAGEKNRSSESAAQEAVHFVIAKTIESLFGIAAIGGICASIIFQKGWDDIETKFLAAWMGIGFGLLSLQCLYWLLLPSAHALEALRTRIR